MKKHCFILLTTAFLAGLFMSSCTQEFEAERSLNEVQSEADLSTKANIEFYEAFQNYPAGVTRNYAPSTDADNQMYKLTLVATLADWLTQKEFGNGDIYNAVYQTWTLGYQPMVTSMRAASGDNTDGMRMLSPHTRAGGGLYDPDVYLGYGVNYEKIMISILNKFSVSGYNGADHEDMLYQIGRGIRDNTGIRLYDEDMEPEILRVIPIIDSLFIPSYDYNILNTVNKLRNTHFGGSQSELDIIARWLPVFLATGPTFDQKKVYFEDLVGYCNNPDVTAEWGTDGVKTKRFLNAMAVGLYAAKVWDMKYNFAIYPTSFTDIAAEGQNITVNINTDSPQVSYVLPDFIEFVNTTGNQYTFNVKPNQSRDPRSGEIIFSYTDGVGIQTVPVTVSQLGIVVNFSTNPGSFRLTTNAQTIEFTVSTNVAYELVSYPNYLTFVSEVGGRYKFNVTENTTIDRRYKYIKFRHDDGAGGTVEYSVLVSQNPVPIIFEVAAGYTNIGGAFPYGQTVYPWVVFVNTNIPYYPALAVYNNWIYHTNYLTYNSYYDVEGSMGDYKYAFRFDLHPNSTSRARNVGAMFWYDHPDQGFREVEVVLVQGPTAGPFYIN